MEQQLQELQNQITELRGIINKYNFSSVQVFTKNIQLLAPAKIRLPNLSADPAEGQIGDIVSVSGKLKICTAASMTAATYTVVGTQT